MQENTMTPGPRQTIDRACHPTLGEGIAVYDNGDAFFQPDGGEPVPMRAIGFGGSGSKPRRSYLWAVTTSGERVELETTGRQGGEVHRRRWSPIFGPGWLVDLPSVPLPAKYGPADYARWHASVGRMRFDPDEGESISFSWTEARVGRLGKKPRRKADIADAENWWTFGSFEFRKEPPPDPAPKAEDKTQASLPGFSAGGSNE